MRDLCPPPGIAAPVREPDLFACYRCKRRHGRIGSYRVGPLVLCSGCAHAWVRLQWWRYRRSNGLPLRGRLPDVRPEDFARLREVCAAAAARP